MTFRESLIAEAREWDGTPFHWQQAVKGKASDCKGWIVCSARELGRPEADAIEAAMVGDHRGCVHTGKLRDGLAKLFDKVAIAEPGDILLLRVGGKPQHLAMYMGNGRMMHCYFKGPSRVIEVPMGHVWWAAVDSVWSWR